MHTLLTVALPLVLVGVAGIAGYLIGARVTANRIARSLQHDRAVGLHVLEDLAQRWNVKVERQETPGGS